MGRTPETGFTLIEILVVCLIIGILGLIAHLHNLITAEESYFASNSRQCYLFNGNATPIDSATSAGVTSCS